MKCIHLLLRALKNQGSLICDAHQLFRALKKNPDVIPREAYPSSIFFLLSLENFKLSLNEWMVYGMESKGYNVC